jgi:16S rRNA (cytosine1402-N4)-methyltransferase
MNSSYHTPVLLEQSVDALGIVPNGRYVDLTYGGGGHSMEILRRLGGGGMLIAFDHDAQAAANAALVSDARFRFVHGSFRYMHNFLRYMGVGAVHGILADLGVSGHHFDDAQRGFSYRMDAPLDMRMNRGMPLTAADIVNTYDEHALRALFAAYGQMEHPMQAARLIAQARKTAPILTTGQLADAVSRAAAPHKRHKCLAQAFQALRIVVNGELTALEQAMEHSRKALLDGGIIAVISYHSLEDRIVKNYLRSGTAQGMPAADEHGNRHSPFRAINSKAIMPTQQEVERNPRSRSARLRVGVRTI